MRRREFIAALGGAAAWPFVARGQQTERVRRVGVLMALGADDPESKARVTAFVQGLAQLGWIIGQNVQVDYRWALNFDDVHRYVAELVALAPDVILTHSSATVAPLLQATRTVPIVFTLIVDRLAPAMSIALRTRAAMLRALPSTSMPSARNGWNYLSR